MANDVKYPAGTYKIVTVGPPREWEFTGNDGSKIQMRTFSVQLEGIAEWIDYNVRPEGEAKDQAETLIGTSIEGHIEDTEKFGLKFVKARKGGFGGKGYSSGAAYANAVQTAATIVTGYYQATATKPKDINEMMQRIEQLTPTVKATVDKLAGAKPVETGDKPETEKKEAVIEDVDEKELNW